MKNGDANLFHSVLDYSERILKWCCVVIMAFFIVAVGVQVFARYILNNPTSWSEALSQIAFIWLTLFGAATVTREKANLHVDLIHEHLKGIYLVICNFLCDIIGMIVTAFWIYSSALQVSNTWAIREGGLTISRGWIYIGILLSFIFMFLYQAEDLVSTGYKLKTRVWKNSDSKTKTEGGNV